MRTWESLIKDKKNQVVLILMTLCAIAAPSGGMRFVLWVIGGVLVCVILDKLFNKFVRHRTASANSSVISGLILSGVLDYHVDWYLLVIFAALAIVSKSVIRFRHKHIFNPAGFGLFAASLFHQPLTWNIESNMYLIVVAGSCLAISLRKWPHALGFLPVFSGTFYFSGINPLNMISWFFLFIMLIEPKTSGAGTWKGLSFGAVAGLTSFVMFKLMPQVDIFVTALIVANIFNAIAAEVALSKWRVMGAKK